MDTKGCLNSTTLVGVMCVMIFGIYWIPMLHAEVLDLNEHQIFNPWSIQTRLIHSPSMMSIVPEVKRI